MTRGSERRLSNNVWVAFELSDHRRVQNWSLRDVNISNSKTKRPRRRKECEATWGVWNGNEDFRPRSSVLASTGRRTSTNRQVELSHRINRHLIESRNTELSHLFDEGFRFRVKFRHCFRLTSGRLLSWHYWNYFRFQMRSCWIQTNLFFLFVFAMTHSFTLVEPKQVLNKYRGLCCSGAVG